MWYLLVLIIKICSTKSLMSMISTVHTKVYNFYPKKKKKEDTQKCEKEGKKSARKVRKRSKCFTITVTFIFFIQFLVFRISYLCSFSYPTQNVPIQLIMKQIIHVYAFIRIHNFSCLSSFVSSLMWWNQWSFTLIDKVKKREKVLPWKYICVTLVTYLIL